MAVVFVALRRHGARPLRSTEAEEEVEAEAVLAVTTSAVLEVLALKPFGYLCVYAYVSLDDLCVVMMINLWSLMVL